MTPLLMGCCCSQVPTFWVWVTAQSSLSLSGAPSFTPDITSRGSRVTGSQSRPRSTRSDPRRTQRPPSAYTGSRAPGRLGGFKGSWSNPKGFKNVPHGSYAYLKYKMLIVDGCFTESTLLDLYLVNTDILLPLSNPEPFVTPVITHS